MYLAAQRNRAIVYRYAYRGLTIFDTRKKTAHTLKNSPDKANSLPSNVINDLQPYKGKLVLSTQAGIVAMNPETETFEPLSPPARRPESYRELYLCNISYRPE